MRSLMLGAVLAALAPALVGAADTSPITSVQKEFEAATALYDAGKFPDALAAWQRLEQRVSTNPRSLAIVRLRKSFVLFSLDRRDEAVASARLALDALPSTDQTLRADRYQGYLVLGRIAEASLDYASAANDYRLADALAPTAIDHLSAMRGMIETETFVDPDRATTDMAKVQPLLTDKAIDARSRATLKRIESQLLLNRGNLAGARAAAGEAVKLLGGLTAGRIDLADVAARSNYAIAAMLLGDKADARKYMAYTGAGRLATGSFDPAVQMTPPDCGGDADLKPDDMAVIEFSVGDDGSVIFASPVYSSRGGQVALEFARAVRNWSWTPEQVKALPLFFRYRARVEMRCSTEFPKPSLTDYLDDSLRRWLADRKIDLPARGSESDVRTLAAMHRELADLEQANGASALALVPALHVLSRNSVAPREDIEASARRELAILIANGAPPSARLAVEIAIWSSEKSDRWTSRAGLRRLEAAVAAEPYASDRQARGVLRLMLADAYRAIDKDRSLLLLNQVTADSAPDEKNPLRVGALIRIASIYAQRGDLTAAKAAYEKTGTSAEQCSLVDSAPRYLGSSGEFPAEAKEWGFEGWSTVQFDVSADGKTINQRPVISYPPFIFSGAATDTLRKARYEKSYRPGGGLGCGGTSQRVKFVNG